MGHSAKAKPVDRLSRVGFPDLPGTNVLCNTSTGVRDSCKCSRYNSDGSCVMERVDHAQVTDLSSTTSYPCASHTTHNQVNSISRSDVRHSRSRQMRLSSSSSHTDSVSSSKKVTTTTTTLDLRRNLHASWSLSSCWFSRRMYTGNIKPWTLSFMFYLFVLILSHQVESTHSVPALSRRVEQRTNNINSLEDYLNALSLNGTNTPRSRYFVNRSPLALNKRSYRRLGRAGSDSGSRINDAFIRKIEDENLRVQCQPRDRVVDSYEELGIARGYGDFLYPECIVVRRCKQGGCCGDERECVPSRTTNVTMNFLKIRQQTPIEIVHETVHDLECECQDKPSFCPEPVVDCPDNKVWSYSECTCKCRNRCPKPFLQDEDTCGCDCLSQDRHCKNIYKGRRNGKLSQEECDCVRKGLCGKPPCINGAFSISDCKCINSNS